MKLIESNGYQIALIEVPYDTAKPIVFHGDLVDNWADEEMLLLKKLPPGSWSILGPGLSTLCSEGDAAKVVETIIDHEYGNSVCYHTGNPYVWHDTALESLHSLIRSHSMKPETTCVLIKKL